MSNPWSVFDNLLPKQPLGVGTAFTVYGDDTVGLTVANGSVRVARGGVDITTGAQYFYRNGRIEGQAPASPVIEVTIY